MEPGGGLGAPQIYTARLIKCILKMQEINSTHWGVLTVPPRDKVDIINSHGVRKPGGGQYPSSGLVSSVQIHGEKRLSLNRISWIL